MKYCLLMIAFLITTSTVLSQESGNYYWYNGEKKYLDLKTDEHFILLDQFIDVNTLIAEFNIESDRIGEIKKANIGSYMVPRQSGIEFNNKDYHFLIISGEENNINLNSPKISYHAPFFKSKSGERVGLSNLFYVRLHREGDIKILEELAEQYHVDILGNNYYMPLWYTLASNRSSSGNALEMANIFYESGYFKAAHPDFIFFNMINSSTVSDPFFLDQWNLNNTGQYGVGIHGADIQMINAWEITEGREEIITAVNDRGISKIHPDLPNIHPVSFDAEGGVGEPEPQSSNDDPPPSVVRGPHGTAVAGIIGAMANNEEGIAGIAPNGMLMSISSNMETSFDGVMKFASAIEFAWENGASIINNSWSFHPEFALDCMDEAINNAINHGRNGLGTVLIFSTGNNDGNLRWPSNNPDVIAVGASSMCDERKSPTSCDTESAWGSNFGTGLDVVAPGVLIPTTDNAFEGYNDEIDPIEIHIINNGTLVSEDYENTSYTIWFHGTSAAAPHVAGIASLMLSINDDLTYDEVRYIIESSAEKVGGYTYTMGAGARPDLTWNEEMGYGRVNAYRALIGTIENHGATLGIEKPLVTLPLFEDMDFHEDVYLASGSTLTIEARENPVTLTSNSGSVTIGKPATGTTQAKPLAGGGDDSGGDVDEIGSETPQKIALSANYPNPFNPVTTIRYELPVNSNVRLEVYDILGRRVAVLVEGLIESGAHEVAFDASNLASGVYLYRLSTADFVQTRQMVLVK